MAPASGRDQRQQPPPPPDLTVGAWLAAAIAADPDAEALVARHQGLRLTYGELGAKVDRLAGGLLALGLDHGDRVALWSPNVAEWLLLHLAATSVGVVVVAVDPTASPDTLAEAIGEHGCRMLFAAPSFGAADFIDAVEVLEPRLATIERSIFFWEDDWDELAAGVDSPGDDAVAARRAELRADDPVIVTSQANADAAVTLTHRDLVGAAASPQPELHGGDRLCLPLPLHRWYGAMVGKLAGADGAVTVVLTGDDFDAATVLQTVAAERCTVLAGTATMFAALGVADFGDLDLSALRVVVLAEPPGDDTTPGNDLTSGLAGRPLPVRRWR